MLLFSINFDLIDPSKGILGGSEKLKKLKFCSPWGYVWTRSSPDLNPLDFFVWGVAERDTKRSPHKTKQSLINTFMELFANFDRESVVNACSRLRFNVF